MQLSDCRVLLTGASGGIGQHIARCLSSAGAKLLLVGRHPHNLAELAAECGAGSESLCADISDSKGRTLVLNAARRFGGVNVMINAAGINDFSLFDEQDEATIAGLIHLNVTSTLLLTQQLLPVLQAQPRAMLINLGSTFGTIGYPGYAAYCASKFAVRGFTEALRRDLAGSSVHVMYVAPRATRTSMNDDAVMAMNKALKVGMDEPQLVASLLANAIQDERRDLYIGWPEKLFVKVNALLPGIVDGAIIKQLPIIQRFARKSR